MNLQQIGMSILKKWYHKNNLVMDSINGEKNVALFVEGLGSYKGTKNKYHPNGRLGACVFVFHGNELVYYSQNASTLPDKPQDLDNKFKKYNGGTPIPTTMIGSNKLYTKYHGKSKPETACELEYRNGKVNVIRNGGISYSTGINIHHRTSAYDNSRYAWSTGCLTILHDKKQNMSDYSKFREGIGITKNGKYIGNEKNIGISIIDRSMISDSLISLYADIYGKYFDKVFNVQDKINTNTTIQINKSKDKLNLIINDNFEQLDGFIKDGKSYIEFTDFLKSINLDYLIKNGKYFVELRNSYETMGKKVSWDNKNKIIKID